MQASVCKHRYVPPAHPSKQVGVAGEDRGMVKVVGLKVYNYAIFGNELFGGVRKK